MGYGYRVVPIGNEPAREVRTALKDPDYGHPATASVAGGYGPCRVCLRKFAVGGDRLILFTHDPFRGVEPFPLPGPVYIHENECTAYDPESGFPAGLADLPLTFNAYAPGRILVSQERVHDPSAVEPAIERAMADSSVAYVHVRNSEAGCFVCTLTRRD